MPIKIIKNTLSYIAERRSFVNEGELRDTLCKNLNDQYDATGWWWSVEGKFQTECLVNSRDIYFDIIGRKEINGEGCEAFLIELKHVTASSESGAPHDTPAFAYDILKDCVKIELAMGGRAAQNEEFLKISGVSVGITDHSVYWDGNGNFDNWATNYLAAIDPFLNERMLFEGVIKTVTNAENKYSRVYRNKRCHLSFGLKWLGEWVDLMGECEDYKFLIINPVDENFSYRHSSLSSDTIPFLDLCAKQEFYEILRAGSDVLLESNKERFVVNNTVQQIQTPPEPLPTLEKVALAITKICRSNTDVFAPSLLRMTMGIDFPNTDTKILSAQIQPHLRYLRAIRAVELIPTHQKRNRPHRVINRDLLLDISANGESILPPSNSSTAVRSEDGGGDEVYEDVEAVTNDDRMNQIIEMEQRLISLEAVVDLLVAKLNALGVILRS